MSLRTGKSIVMLALMMCARIAHAVTADFIAFGNVIILPGQEARSRKLFVKVYVSFQKL
jgi:ABC-type antimicrobial peptide transport system ATPase subunit